jgi:class 3 adenylate cyclase
MANSNNARGIVVFTGHMMDKVGRVPPLYVPRFPKDKEDDVTAAISNALETLNPSAGFCSAACGGDIIFIEQMLLRDAEVHVVLPYEEQLFIDDCVHAPESSGIEHRFQENSGMYWRTRFLDLRQRITSILTIGDKRPRDNAMSSDCCNRVFLGLGLMKAQSTSSPVKMLALWDGWSGDAPGGTRAIIKLAHSLGVEVEYLPELYPKKVEDIIRTATPPAGISAQPFRATIDEEPPQQICAILFADVVRFSDLDESQLPGFVTGYLGPLASLLQRSRHRGYGPLDFNTWGDGLFCVFNSMLKAGRFALEMQKLTSSGEWLLSGSNRSLTLRIALHAGPVYRIPDPVVSKDTFVGTNINLAARIEAATDKGEIYCSQAFAALAAAEGVRDFSCAYIGKRELAKGFGSRDLYRIREVLDSGVV